ncbi:MAG TPA: FadR/GntR family transcriptional regulator [Bacillales bacterium]|nr:FadR/GntR family transcriptional regulator [Bacillales bacterium]
MQYKSIKAPKIYERVADELLQMIKQGVLEPGQKLDSVEKLARHFDVGRSAIREALSALRAMGLVEMRQGEGTYIRQFDPKTLGHSISSAVLMKKEDVYHLLEVRKIIEVGAVALAAEKRRDEDLTGITAALTEMKDAIGNEELGEKADWKFHMAIVKASQNPMLVNLLDSVSEMMTATMLETRRLWFYSKETTAERLLREHMEIFTAIEERDSEKASQLMFDHLLKVEGILIKYYRGPQDERAES